MASAAAPRLPPLLPHGSDFRLSPSLRAQVHYGAAKYVSDSDNDLLSAETVCEGFLVKKVRRMRGCRRRSAAVLEWVVLKRHEGRLAVLYTKKDQSGFRGATKKLLLGKARYYGVKIGFLVVDKKGREKKIVEFRETKTAGAVAVQGQRLPLSDWWRHLAGHVAPGPDWVVVEDGWSKRRE